MFSRQIKLRFPLLSTHSALSQKSIALASWRNHGPRPYGTRHFPRRVLFRPVLCNLPRFVLRERGSKVRKIIVDIREIADSKVASRNASSPINSSPPFLVKRNFIVISSFSLSLSTLPLVKSHELVFIRGIPL